MTANTDNLIGGTDGPTPMFAVPEEVDAVETYEYTLTVSADNADSATEEVTVTVRNKSDITVTCTGNPYEAYEGADDITLDCSATGAPSGSTYRYVWTGARQYGEHGPAHCRYGRSHADVRGAGQCRCEHGLRVYADGFLRGRIRRTAPSTLR